MCDDDKNSYVLRDLSARCKNFKSRLTHDYFAKKTKNDKDHKPWEVYVGINVDDWEKFKAIREDSDFQSLSDQNRSNKEKNEHPHLLGRGGYINREEQHVKEQMKNNALSGESDTSTVRMITPRPHYERWIDGRKNKNGEISNPNTKLVVEKINKLKEAQKSGEFTSEGSHDILSEALGTPEHGGYVRGIGGKSTLSSYFKRKKRSCQNEGTMTFKQVEKFSIQLTEQGNKQGKK